MTRPPSLLCAPPVVGRISDPPNGLDNQGDALETQSSGATDKRPGWETAHSQSESLPSQVPLLYITNALRRAFIGGNNEQADYTRRIAQEIADECGIPRDKMRNLIVDARIHELRSEFEDLDFMNQFTQDFDDAS